MDANELNTRRRHFVAKYLETGNATQSALAAGYANSSAAVQGSRLLADPTVSAIIDEENKARLDRLSVSADWIVSRLKTESLDYSKEASHGARVTALATLAKIAGLYQKDIYTAPPVQFIFNLDAPVIEHGR